MKTQRDCFDEWQAECAKMIARIDAIDKDTPHEGGPNADAPNWWVEMQNVRRKLQSVVRD